LEHKIKPLNKYDAQTIEEWQNRLNFKGLCCSIKEANSEKQQI
jgi:hypothetical protein